jgi:hypothetical protein
MMPVGDDSMPTDDEQSTYHGVEARRSLMGRQKRDLVHARASDS